jgi:hypothetical protein
VLRIRRAVQAARQALPRDGMLCPPPAERHLVAITRNPIRNALYNRTFHKCAGNDAPLGHCRGGRLWTVDTPCFTPLRVRGISALGNSNIRSPTNLNLRSCHLLISTTVRVNSMSYSRLLGCQPRPPTRPLQSPSREKPESCRGKVLCFQPFNISFATAAQLGGQSSDGPCFSTAAALWRNCAPVTRHGCIKRNINICHG